MEIAMTYTYVEANFGLDSFNCCSDSPDEKAFVIR
jgi:hypothetical protein